MSYRGSAYRGPGDRSRSPPRFGGGDRRSSTAGLFDSRHSGPPPRGASDAPRGPRSQSQFDGPPARGPPPSGLNSGPAPRTLRDAPPLGTGDRARPPFRERDYPERRERSPPPPPPLRDRSPPRKLTEPRDLPRDLPPRDLDVSRARRPSRDGPPSAGSTYSDNPPFSSSSTFRGSYPRGRGGRGGGEYFDRGSTRGGRRGIDDRPDLFRRDRSPPPRYGRDLSRDGRDPERRDDRRYERRDDDRRAEWLDRERELDRPRREPPLGRPETRVSSDALASANPPYPPAQAPPINPERLAIIASSGTDTTARRPSSAQVVSPTTRRELQSETPANISARADSTAHRYASRGSSSPTQAPPVPAFSSWVTPTSAGAQPPQAARPPLDTSSAPPVEDIPEDPKTSAEDKLAPPANAPTAPRALPAAKTHHASPPPMAPKAPRALELDSSTPPANRLQGVRSLETLSGPHQHPGSDHPTARPPTLPPSPTTARPPLTHLDQPYSPNSSTAARFTELAAPTGPKASRIPPALPATSPRPAFTSPRSDAGVFQSTSTSLQRGQSPPLSAPSGPRNRSFSVSPKIGNSNIPTAPRAGRVPPTAPRANERNIAPPTRPLDRTAGMPPFVPPGPRGHAQWNQWRRPPLYGDKPGFSVPAKRDHNGDEKENQDRADHLAATANHVAALNAEVKEEQDSDKAEATESRPASSDRQEEMDVDPGSIRRRSTQTEGHSAAQSFFGKTLEKSEDDVASSSDEDELDEEEDATLLEAKHARQERELRSKMFNLGGRNYRGTSPLESIARLFRLSDKDMERLGTQRDEDIEMEDAAAPQKRRAPAATLSSESDDGPDIPTPQGEDVHTVAIREHEEGHGGVRRVRKRTPEPVPLPYLTKDQELLPLQDREAFHENISVLEEAEVDVLAELERVVQAEEDLDEDYQDDFDEFYKRWRYDCENFDREQEEQEKLERQQSAEPGPELDAPSTVPLNPILEGRRLHKYSSEYALEQVLKQSEETARIEQERAEREAKKNQADMEKEARLPDQQTEDEVDRSMLIDANRFRDPKTLTMVFSYEPPADDFDEHEQQIFIAAFKDTPKKWGEIASLLPGRTYKDCIQHYYANKWDGRFRDNRAKKFKGGRRGRGGKARPSRGSALMADLDRGEDLVQPNESATGRPKRAAAPTTFGEREIESKGALSGQSPAKKLGGAKDGNGEGTEKKRRKTEGSKPGRKAKTQPAIIAAAPSMSPNKPMLPGVHMKDDLVNIRTLSEAGHPTGPSDGHGLQPSDGHLVFSQNGFMGQQGLGDDPDRPKPQSAQRPGASSYWSVPEQTDFFKYIAHFGTDFGAIASHMGTKTQVMIKNHYQRQIDGGRADLEELAMIANDRRQRGQDIGPPPKPTPIIKRRYDNPQSNTPRALAPQADAMETDEPTPPSQPPSSKHASPPQLHTQPKPRYPASEQNTPIPPRVMPNPLGVPPASIPGPPPSAPHSRPLGHPLGPRYHLLGETRAESRPNMQASAGFRIPHEDTAVPRSQPPPPASQAARPSSNSLDHARNPQYIRGLEQERERALKIQSMQIAEQMHGRHDLMPLPHSHGSPPNHPVPGPMAERKPMNEERVPTPPHSSLFAAGRPPVLGPSTSSAPPPSGPPVTSLTARPPYNPSPTKHDLVRPGSVPAPVPIPPTPAPAPISAPPPSVVSVPEPPKRSNLLSILNSEPEEPKSAPKRESLPSAPTRVASPAHGAYPPSTGASGMSVSAQPRREPFGQPPLSGSQAHFHRASYGQGHSANTPPTPVNHEPPSGPPSQQQTASHDWSSRVLNQGGQSSPLTNPGSLDREPPRFYPPGRSLLGSLGPSRVNPSPPPHALHSRTPSLTAQQAIPPARDQRSILGGAPLGNPHPSSQPPHTNPYAAPQPLPPYSQAPAMAHNRSHHSHNSSLSESAGGIPRFASASAHQSREDLLRSEDDHRRARKREEDAYRARVEALHAEKSRDSYLAQQDADRQRRHQHQQQQQHQQQPYSRGPLGPPMQPHAPYESGYPPASAGGGGAYSVREQSVRDSEIMMERERRMYEESEQRELHARQDQMGYRRAEEFFPRRPTPYGGAQGYAAPPPPPNGPGAGPGQSQGRR